MTAPPPLERGPQGVGGWLGGPLGGLVARPWLDPVALWALTRAHLPLSRAWAAAAVAEGSVKRFLAELPRERLPVGTAGQVGRALAKVTVLRERHDAAAAAWEAGFYGPGGDPGSAALAALETARRRASHAYMTVGRTAFAGLKLRAAWPAVRWEIPEHAAVEARFEALLADPRQAFAPPDPLPEPEVSHAVESGGVREFWVRFACPLPAIGGQAWAQVREPVGVAAPPTLIMGHGVCVEMDSLAGMGDEAGALPGLGLRLVRMQAPWHDRRRPPGRYGGEPFFGAQPTGALDLFAAAVRELAVMVAWCRRRGAGRVGVGGASMGALIAQLAAGHSPAWPAACRPDLLYAVTTGDDVGGLIFTSSLARSVGLPQVLQRAGWAVEDLDRFRPLADPPPAPPLPPADMVMVLGRRDTVTPYAAGRSLAERWRVAPENLFLGPGGHFSVPLGVMRDPAPLRRVIERLRA
ncbi:MAG: alpha/beta hydrolase family protein [Dongiaceae bacterium]